MLSPLNTVKDYVDDIRVILLDKTLPFRYTDDEIMVGFNTALLDARRVRADLFVHRHGTEVPYFRTVDGSPVPIEPQFRLAFIYGTAAHTLLRDDEDVQDERANAFLEKFYDLLTGIRPAQIRGGTPGPRKQSARE